MTKTPLTIERLREVLAYDPETGFFSRKTHVRGPRGKGQPGCIQGDGYRQIGIDSARFLAHRLAWFYVTGSWPLGWLDHVNGLRDDNRIKNLREATPAQNAINSHVRSDSLSGQRGVSYRPRFKKWTARITVNKTRIQIGYFCTMEEAVSAYRAEAAKHFGEFRFEQRQYVLERGPVTERALIPPKT